MTIKTLAPLARYRVMNLGRLMVAVVGGYALAAYTANQQIKRCAKTPGYRLVEILNVASMSGLLIATAAYFIANRVVVYLFTCYQSGNWGDDTCSVPLNMDNELWLVSI